MGDHTHREREREGAKWVGWLQFVNTMTALQQTELKQTSLDTDGEKRQKTVKHSESGDIIILMRAGGLLNSPKNCRATIKETVNNTAFSNLWMLHPLWSGNYLTCIQHEHCTSQTWIYLIERISSQYLHSHFSETKLSAAVSPESLLCAVPPGALIFCRKLLMGSLSFIDPAKQSKKKGVYTASVCVWLDGGEIVQGARMHVCLLGSLPGRAVIIMLRATDGFSGNGEVPLQRSTNDMRESRRDIISVKSQGHGKSRKEAQVIQAHYAIKHLMVH